MTPTARGYEFRAWDNALGFVFPVTLDKAGHWWAHVRLVDLVRGAINCTDVGTHAPTIGELETLTRARIAEQVPIIEDDIWRSQQGAISSGRLDWKSEADRCVADLRQFAQRVGVELVRFRTEGNSS